MKSFSKVFKSINKTSILFLAFLIILPATRSLFRSEFFHIHDFTHVARLFEMDMAIKDGHFPVRWSKDFGFGYGMPLFNFYGPLPFYIAEIFKIIGFSYLNSIKMLIFINFYISFLSMYYLTKYFWGKFGALISASAFIYVPYRALNVFVRGSLNELTSITFISLSLYFLIMIMRKKKNKWVIFSSLSLAGIVLSHNISALMSYPFLFVYAIILSLKYQHGICKQKLFRVLTSFVLGVGLSAFYAIPSFIEKSYTAINSITSGYFHYSQHFLYLRQLINSEWGYGGSVFGLEDGLSFEIGKLHIILGIIGVIAFIKLRERKRITKTTIILSSIFIIISILMTTFKTKFIWDKISLLTYIQFPWRFLSIIMIFSSILVGGSIKIINKSKTTSKIIFTTITILSFIFINFNYFKPKEFLDDNQSLYYTDIDRIQTDMSVTLPDYIHPDSPTTLTPPTSRFQLKIGDQIQDIVPIIDRTHEFLAQVNLDKNATFIANIFDFPGWEFYVNDEKINTNLGSDLPYQTIELDPNKLGTGNIYITGRFTESSIRKIANSISIITLLIISYISFHERYARSTS